MRIVAREKAKKGNLPVHFGADPAAIELNDEMITQVIPMKNMDAVKLRTELAPIIGTWPEPPFLESGPGKLDAILTLNS